MYIVSFSLWMAWVHESHESNDLELNLFNYILRRLIFKELSFQYMLFFSCHLLYVFCIFFSHKKNATFKIFRSLSGIININALFGSNPSITIGCKRCAWRIHCRLYRTLLDRIVVQFAHNLGQNALFSALRTASWTYETVLLPPPHHTLLISRGIFRFQWGRGRRGYESLVRYAVCEARSLEQIAR